MTDAKLRAWLRQQTPLQIIHRKGECLNVRLTRITPHAIFVVEVGLQSPVGMLLKINVLEIIPLIDEEPHADDNND